MPAPCRPAALRPPVPAYRFIVLLLVLVMLGVSACRPPLEEFRCDSDRQCIHQGLEGFCESDGYCGFPDETCAAGSRYGEHAPAQLRGSCVERPFCGDGVVSQGEACDDGNQAESDGCTSGCVVCDDSIGTARLGAEGGSCYSRHEPSTWENAQHICLGLGGHLVTFSHNHEQRTVETLLPGTGRASFWIGNRMSLPLKETHWITNEPQLANTWAPRGRESRRPGQTCAAMSPGRRQPSLDLNYVWALTDCDDENPFVCESPPWQINRRNGKAYRIIHESLTWEEGEASCRRLGGGLATIADEAENAFIISRFSGPFWIGANDRETEGKFLWPDGEPIEFQDFATREPDNFYDNQNCVLLDGDGRWHDRGCQRYYHALCQLR